MTDYKDHWNKVYSKNEIRNLGWFEDIPKPSLDLIDRCDLDRDAVILDIGSGTSTLIENLLRLGYSDITAVDISEVALSKAKVVLDAGTTDPGSAASEAVQWIVDDVTDPKRLSDLGQIDLWHDRTVLHFLTDEQQRAGYVNTLNRLVKPGGYVIIAAFSLTGAKKCSGLDVINYDQNMIAELLGSEYELIEDLEYVYTQPSGGLRPFVYTRFKRSA